MVAIGRVVKPHGIRGEVAVEVLSDVPGRFDAGGVVTLAGAPATIASTRPHQGRLLVRFEGVDDRTAAERLRGRLIEAEAVDLTGQDTYYAHELVGMAVVAEDGADLGRVTALIELPPTAGYDLLEVTRPDGSSWLLPAVDDFVEVEDTAAGAEALRLVDPPEGLVDDSMAEDAGRPPREDGA